MLLKHHNPFPTPPSPFPPNIWGKNLQFCKCYCARGLWAAENQAELGDRAKVPSSSPPSSKATAFQMPSVGLPLSPKGRGFIVPFVHIRGFFRPWGWKLTSYRTVATPGSSATSLVKRNLS